ncbi:MAG TPA: hypothetical protein VJ925_01655 [Longimicrobiales bacterium]|nr:hypothetical protein [Longimicrobiales bacterium]
MPATRTTFLTAVVLIASVGTGALTAQEYRQGFAFTLATDSSELARVSELAQQQLTPPVSAGPLTGAFRFGRIYPFDRPGRYVVVGVLEDDASGEAFQVLHPFGDGVEGTPSHVLRPAEEAVDITRVGDLFDTGGFAVFFCDRSAGGGVPTVVVYNGGWSEQAVSESGMWRCAPDRTLRAGPARRGGISTSPS